MSYLSDEGYSVEWYDLSYDTGRNAKGYMIYNPVAEKYKIILHTKPLNKTEMTAFFNKIAANKKLTVTFFDPYTATTKTIYCYRGDRSVTMKWNRTSTGILYTPTDIGLIEL